MLEILFGQLKNHIGLFIAGSVLMALVPLALITLFTKIDEEISDKLKPSKKDIAVIVVTGTLISVLVTGTKAMNIMCWINFIVMMAYLVFMSYTDQKTKLVYTVTSVVMIVLEIVVLMTHPEIKMINMLITLIIPAIIQIACIFKFIGMGDSLIFWNLALYLSVWSYDSVWFMLILVLLSNILFVVSALYKKIVKSKKDKRLPYTLYITIAAFIVFLIIPIY